MSAAERENDLLKLQVRNFGPIVEADIDLRPLTLFVGPSNTGKSYLAILIYALQRLPNLRAFPSKFHSQLDFQKLRKTLNAVQKEFFAWGRAAAHSNLESGLFQTPLPDHVAELVRSMLSTIDKDFSDLAEEEISRCFGVIETDRLIRRSSKRSSEIVLQHFVGTDHEREKPFQHTFSFSKGKATSMMSIIPDGKPLHADQRGVRVFGSNLRRMLRNPELFEGEWSGSKIVRYVIPELAEAVFPYVFGRHWNSPYYLPADRTGVMHAHQVVVSALVGRAADAAFRQESPLPTLSGVLADFLQRLIALDRSDPFRRDRSRTRNREGENLAKYLEKEVLDGAVRKESLPGLSYPTFFYQPEGWKDNFLPLMRSSSMVSELAPVVLYLRHVVQTGDTLIIEEPEAHLHPAKQVEFMRSLAAMVRAGIRVIMTTHSEWVLEELANLVRASGLSDADRKALGVEGVSLRPEDVGAWLFRSKQRPKGSVVQEIPLVSDSNLFPAGYEDVAFELHNRGVKIDSLAEADAAT